MRRRLIIVIGMLGAGLSFGWYVLAQNNDAVPTFVPGQILTAEALHRKVEQVDTNTAALSGGSSDRPLRVNCDTGDSLAQAVQSAAPHSTIRVSGTCSEQVTIRTDGLTLLGRKNAVLQGDGGTGSPGAEPSGVLTIRGARDVTVQGFTIQNGNLDGLVAIQGASVTLRDLTAQDNAFNGITINSNATVTIADVTARRNGQFGIFLANGARGILRGDITATQNSQTTPTAGIGLDNGASAMVDGATIRANNNNVDGIGLGNGSHLRDFPGAGGTITANGNGNDGFHMFNSSWVVLANNTTVTVRENGRYGIWVIGNAGVVTVPGNTAGVSSFATFLLEDNPVGFYLDVQGAGFFIGGLTIRNNTTGIVASGADTLTVVSIPPNPSSLTGNTTDVNLSFGTRATFDGVTIDTFTCDATVLSRGSTVCP